MGEHVRQSDQYREPKQANELVVLLDSCNGKYIKPNTCIHDEKTPDAVTHEGS